MSAFSEQQDEVEALCAIYPSEFESISTHPLAYKIHLTPNSGQGENHVAVSLVCNIPENYPEILPILSIEVEKGLGKKHADELSDLVKAKAEENLGMPLIYIVAEAVREWLVDNNVPGQDGSMYAEMTRRMQQKDVEQKRKEEKAVAKQMADSESVEVELDPEEEERIRRRQAGTPVTMESFLRWREQFEAEERDRQRALLGKSGGGSGSGSGSGSLQNEEKLTGKQFFLTNSSAGLEDDVDVDAETMPSDDGTDSVQIDENLFVDDDEEEDDEDYEGENESDGDEES